MYNSARKDEEWSQEIFDRFRIDAKWGIPGGIFIIQVATAIAPRRIGEQSIQNEQRLRYGSGSVHAQIREYKVL